MNRYESYCRIVSHFRNLFIKAKENNLIVCISPKDNEQICIDVTKVKLIASMCPECENLFHRLFIKGSSYVDEETFLPYEGHLEGYEIMCECHVTDYEAWSNDDADMEIYMNLNIDDHGIEKPWSSFISRSTPITLCDRSTLDSFLFNQLIQSMIKQ